MTDAKTRLAEIRAATEQSLSEGAGGDQTTVSPSEAMARGAKVEFHQSQRRDLVGVRFL